MGLFSFIEYLLRCVFVPNAPSTMELKMLRLLNRDRGRNRLRALFMQDDLRNVARKHSKDMAKLDYFEHENPLGHTHADRYKMERITEVVSGENLAKISGYPLPVHRAEIGLMNSPGHRANILNKAYNCVGIGVHKSEKKVYYFTQNFAYRPLILLGKIPKKIRPRTDFCLTFKPAEKILTGYYQVREGKMVIREKPFKILEGKNLLKIPFNSLGLYRTDIFVNHAGSSRFSLSNSFELRVSDSWF